MEESVSNTSTFYKLCSLGIDEAIADNTRKKIDIADDYLQSLLTREVMTDDYPTNDRLQADYSFVYNNRINLAAVKRSPFKGFLAQSMFSFTSISYFIWAADSSTITITPNKSSNTKCSVKVYIKEDGEDYIVDRSVESIDEYKIGTFTSYMTDNTRSWATYLFYPNVNAYKMIMYDTISNLLRGDKMSMSFKDNWAVPEIAYYMITTGESTGQISEMLDKVSDFYKVQEINISDKLKTFIEPFLIVVLAVMVGVILIAVILPIFQMYNQLL